LKTGTTKLQYSSRKRLPIARACSYDSTIQNLMEFAMHFSLRVPHLALATLLVCASQLALAQGDAVKGRELTYTCGGCHGIEQYKNAYPQYNVPKIVDQNYDYLLAALKAYKSEERSHPTMRAQAQSFNDADLENIAAYLSNYSAPEHK
jgi:cytochrome c553